MVSKREGQLSSDIAIQDFEQLLGAIRPRLHRYCARMTGSTTDGEDIVQEALMKAFAARPAAGVIDNAEAWLLRIAHNSALDFLRHRARQPVTEAGEDFELVPAPDAPDPDIVAASLQRFMQLPALQRSAVILKDVLGHSVQEAAAITDASEPALKSALQRGRARLRVVAGKKWASTLAVTRRVGSGASRPPSSTTGPRCWSMTALSPPQIPPISWRSISRKTRSLPCAIFFLPAMRWTDSRREPCSPG